ncbi:MAG: hypothetical protein RLZZ341_1081 [Pseudomonadota bacterium]|jgi:hypothetical protein
MSNPATAARAPRLRQHYRPSRLRAPAWLRQLWAWL